MSLEKVTEEFQYSGLAYRKKIIAILMFDLLYYRQRKGRSM